MLLPGCGENGINIFSASEEVELGQQFISEIYANPREFPLLDSVAYPLAYQRLGQITQKILASEHIRHRKEFAWKMHIVNDDSVLNAFCTPGGYIFVYTGLIKYLDSEDQLAGVLGHEIAHADLRHSTEQLTKNLGLQLVTRLIAGEASGLVNVADRLLALNFSRKDETEADLKSVEYLYDTDYDPRGVARFFQKMHRTDKRNDIEQHLDFLNTHPDPQNRVEKIMEYWHSLGSQKGKTYKEKYIEMKESLP